MLNSNEFKCYLNKIPNVLTTWEHQVFQWAGLQNLSDQFLEIAHRASNEQFTQFANAMHLAEVMVRRRLNN